MAEIILASASAARQAMLRNAGLSFAVVPAQIDESAIRDALRAEGTGGRDIADALAEAKALKLSRRFPAALVIGCDQMLQCADGSLLDKPQSPEEAAVQLQALSGASHQLLSAVVLAQGGSAIWRHIGLASMTIRRLSDDFITAYVAAHWDEIRHCVGCYQVEAAGVQLFSAIDGDPYTIQGLPMLELLDYLRVSGRTMA
jgi:septum formation protein